MKRDILTGVAVLLAANFLLCSCDKTPGNGAAGTGGETAVTAAVSPEDLAGAAAYAARGSAGETEDEEAEEPEDAPIVIPDDTLIVTDESGKLTLDGDPEHHYILTDYCYIVSDEYVLFLDKDIDLPGDFKINIDAIFGELEDQLGLEACPEDFYYTELPDPSYFIGGVNPWEGFDIGSRLPVFIISDRDAAGFISNGGPTSVVICDYGLFTEEVQDAVYEYYDEWYRTEYVNYSAIAHELTHAITMRNAITTKIMAEGIAQFMENSVTEALADEYPSIGVVEENYELCDYPLPEAVNADNAERIFIEDYMYLHIDDRGAEYTYGRHLCEYLCETFGEDFYRRYNDAINDAGMHYPYNQYNVDIMTQYAEVLKDTFGDDVFTNFGDWCVENGLLQDVDEYLAGMAY